MVSNGVNVLYRRILTQSKYQNPNQSSRVFVHCFVGAALAAILFDLPSWGLAFPDRSIVGVALLETPKPCSTLFDNLCLFVFICVHLWLKIFSFYEKPHQ